MKGIGLGILKGFWKQIALVAVIYIVMALLPSKNIISLNLSVIIPILLYKAYSEKPVLKDWVRTILMTAAWITGFFLLISFLGLLGIIGFIIIMALLIGWRLWKGRKLLTYTINWGADALHGRKKDFDASKLEPEKINEFDSTLKDMIKKEE